MLFASSKTILMQRKTMKPHFPSPRLTFFRSKNQLALSFFLRRTNRMDCQTLSHRSSTVPSKISASPLGHGNRRTIFASLELFPIQHAFLDRWQRRFCSWSFSSLGFLRSRLLATNDVKQISFDKAQPLASNEQVIQRLLRFSLLWSGISLSPHFLACES